jgi:hypothetical protein
MIVRIRLTRRLYDEVRVDLARPHVFAAERVGFLFGRLGNAQTNEPMVLFTGYNSLDDERYINDPNSGARIDSHAIRGAIQQVINRHEGVFHVHMHEWIGKPRFGRMDRDELSRLVPGFQVVGPKFAHGLFLMSKDECAAEIWMPGQADPVEAAGITIVGYPMHKIDGGER